MCIFVTMPYKDPAKRRECHRRWRDENRERVNAQRRKRWRERKEKKKDDGGLHVVLTPLTGLVYETSLHRLRRRNAEKVKEVKRKKWRERANTEKVKEVKRKWWERNREKALERNREWKKANREKVKEGKKGWREQNREKVREHNRGWKKANAEKVKEGKKRWREQNWEKVREDNMNWKKANAEKVEASRRRWRDGKKAQSLRLENEGKLGPRDIRKNANERQRIWRKANPEKVREQKRRWRERKKKKKVQPLQIKIVRQLSLHEIRKKANERQQRYRKDNPESREDVRERARQYYQRNKEQVCEKRKVYRRNRKEKCASNEEYREQHRGCRKEADRRYYQKHRERLLETQKKRRASKRELRNERKESRQPVLPPPCDCGLCLACGGWTAPWQPAWHVRLEAWLTPDAVAERKDRPPMELEELPLDLLESEAETLSTASTSEIGSEWGDRLDALLANESDSEVETGPVKAPTRRSSRIATMPAVSYQDWEEENPMLELLRRKAQLHAEAADRIVTRWELLDQRTERVDAIVEEMSAGVDPHRELDRFQSQLERQDSVMNVMVSEELLDFVDGQL